MPHPKYNHLMIDLETLGVNPQAPIISIGACAFCVETAKIGKTFYKNVEWDTSRFKPDGSTLQWWLLQSSDAKKALIDKDKNEISIAIESLSDFILKLTTTRSLVQYVWANSPAFDCVILRNAYNVCGMQPPWKFWMERDVRTIRDGLLDKDRCNDGIKHNALDDAIDQAHDVIRYYTRKMM